MESVLWDNIPTDCRFLVKMTEHDETVSLYDVNGKIDLLSILDSLQDNIANIEIMADISGKWMIYSGAGTTCPGPQH